MDRVRLQVTPVVVQSLTQAGGLRVEPGRAEELVSHVQAGLDASAHLEEIDLSDAEPTFFLRPSLLSSEANRDRS